MANLHKNKNIKTLIVSIFEESAGPGGVRKLHKYHIWYFGPHFPDIGHWECPSKEIMLCLAILSQNWKWYCQIYQKTTLFCAKN